MQITVKEYQAIESYVDRNGRPVGKVEDEEYEYQVSHYNVRDDKNIIIAKFDTFEEAKEFVENSRKEA